MAVERQKALQANLKLRARTFSAVRHFFNLQGYLEVETPIRIPAPTPEAHIEPQPSGEWYLHTSPELYMKRLLAAGYSRIFQICKCFRYQERGRRHLPEMTLLEWYTAGAGYHAMMDQTEDLITAVAQDLGYGRDLVYSGRRIDLKPAWPRLSVTEAFAAYSDVTPQQALDQDRFDEVLGLTVEPQLGLDRPVFLYDYPAACGALARTRAGAPHLAERFELYIAGLEICNGFSELNDPQEQRRRFESETASRQTAGKPVWPLPEVFLSELAHMPPAAGNALGLDRLVMLFADADRIDDVVSFTPEEL